jgi:hypothetical protein
MNTTATRTPLATEKQIDYLLRLSTERDFESLPALAATITEAQQGIVGRQSASTAIDILLTKPRKATMNVDGGAVSEGYFWVNGLIYKVQAAQSTGNLYAKVFSESGYEYAPGAMRLMKDAQRLTLEQASEAGVRTGRCVVCARTLTDPESVAAGIGPVCAARI